MYSSYVFTSKDIPNRMKNAIKDELARDDCILPSYDLDLREGIPLWIIVRWAEEGLLKRLPNVGKKTIEDTLWDIYYILKERN